MVPSCRASARASSSTTGPRAVFTTTAWGRSRASSRAPMRCRVVSVSGTCTLRTSHSASRSSSAGDVAGHAGGVAGVVQHLHAESRRPAGPRPDRCARSRRGPRVAPCTSLPRYWLMPHPDHAPPRRSRSASEARREAASTRRKATSAVVSSSTPGVLHTATPSRGGGLDVDVVVARRRRWRPPAGFSTRPPASTGSSIRSVSRHTTASTGRGQLDELDVGVGRVVGALAPRRVPRRRAGRGPPRGAGGSRGRGPRTAISGWCSRSAPSPSRRWRSRSSGSARGRSRAGGCGPCRAGCGPGRPGRCRDPRRRWS